MKAFRLTGGSWRTLFLSGVGLTSLATATLGSENVLLTEVPDYSWYAGCFGTASGNLMGYWDRHGFPNFYTGPTGAGVAPLDSDGLNVGIRSMWASKAGLDGRPASQFGHIDDYWMYYIDDQSFSYESTAPDPYMTAGRAEHPPDCIGDFIGLSQKKWVDLNGECDGNIDAFSFVFWDKAGEKRLNYVPGSTNNGPAIPDIPSGLRAWTRYRGSDADVFSQLADFNPTVQTGKGFGFADLKAEIDAGYPVLIYLQEYDQLSRSLGGDTPLNPPMPHANPEIHGMLAYGYYVADSGRQYVRYKTSWGGSGDNTLSFWGSDVWQAQLPVRGFIGYHPLPQITGISPAGSSIRIDWDGPSSTLSNVVTQVATPLHWYVVEKATQLAPPDFQPVSDPVTDRSLVVTDCCPDKAAFYRVKLVPAPAAAQQIRGGG